MQNYHKIGDRFPFDGVVLEVVENIHFGCFGNTTADKCYFLNNGGCHAPLGINCENKMIFRELKQGVPGAETTQGSGK